MANSALGEGLNFSEPGFIDLDRSSQAALMIRSMDQTAQWPAVQRLNRQTVTHLNVRPGDHALDVGCGTGDRADASSSR